MADEPSFQDIFKLMNALSSFEGLLDTCWTLTPETCIKHGIHDQFKRLHGKLGKYVQHEETKELNFTSICNICRNEIKILNFDIRTSLAIHNAGELHRVAAKNIEVSEQSQDIVGKSVPQLIDLNNFQSESLKPTYELPPTAAKNVDIKSQDWNLKSIPQLIDFNNIPSELLKPKSNENSISQNKVFVNNINANVSSSCTCQQVFCICGYKDSNMPNLNEKLSNLGLRVSHEAGMYSVPPPPLFPPQGFKQPYATRGRNPSPQSRPNKKQQEKRSENTRLAHVESTPTPQNRYNKKQPEKRHVNTPAVTVESSLPQQRVNIHVHMPHSAAQSAANPTQRPAPRYQDRRKTNSTEENLEILRTKTLGYQEEMQLMFKMVKEAEGQYWGRRHFTKIHDQEQMRNEYICNVCNTGSRMACSFHVVQHVRGRTHQDNLRSAQSIPQYEDERENEDKSECVIM